MSNKTMLPAENVLYTDDTPKTNAPTESTPKTKTQANTLNKKKLPQTKHFPPDLLPDFPPELPIIPHSPFTEPSPLWTREQATQALLKLMDDCEKTRDTLAVIKELNQLHGYNKNQTAESLPQLPVLSINFINKPEA